LSRLTVVGEARLRQNFTCLRVWDLGDIWLARHKGAVQQETQPLEAKFCKYTLERRETFSPRKELSEKKEGSQHEDGVGDRLLQGRVRRCEGQVRVTDQGGWETKGL
jgi:hypothetical protein